MHMFHQGDEQDDILTALIFVAFAELCDDAQDDVWTAVTRDSKSCVCLHIVQQYRDPDNKTDSSS